MFPVKSAFAALARQLDDSNGNSDASVGEQITPIDEFSLNFDFSSKWNVGEEVPIVVTASDFYPNTDVNIRYSRGGALVGLQNGESLLVQGQYTVSVLFGALYIDEIEVRTPVNIVATSMSSLPLLKCKGDGSKFSHEALSGSFCTIIEISNHDVGLANVYNVQQHLKYILPAATNECMFKIVTGSEFNVVANTFPDSWINTVTNLVSSAAHSPLKVLILGNKNTGKSTLAKFLCNKSIELTAGRVNVLDIDPGQPEFTYPLTLSLSTLETPIYGTVIPDLIPYAKQKTRFYGFNTPAVLPLSYFSHLSSLIDSDNAKTSTIINSPGWTKGFGVDIVRFIMESVALTHIIILNESARELDLLRELAIPEHINIINLPAISMDVPLANPVSASTIRNFKILCPLHKVDAEPKFDFTPLLNRSPLQLSYYDKNQVKLHASGFVGLNCISILDSQGISAFDLAECLETQIAGLISVSASDFQAIDARAMLHAPNMPLVLPESELNALSNQRFEAYCCIHSLDTRSHMVNLFVSSINPQLVTELTQGLRRLILVVGKTTIASEELQLKRWSGIVPYTAPAVTVVGSRPVSIRRTVQRGRIH